MFTRGLGATRQKTEIAMTDDARAPLRALAEKIEQQFPVVVWKNGELTSLFAPEGEERLIRVSQAAEFAEAVQSQAEAQLKKLEAELEAEDEIRRTDPAEQRADRYAMEALDLSTRLVAAEARLTHWQKLGESVRIENARLQEKAKELGLSLPEDRQGYTGQHTAFSIIAGLEARLTALEREPVLKSVYGESANGFFTKLLARFYDYAYFEKIQKADADLASCVSRLAEVEAENKELKARPKFHRFSMNLCWPDEPNKPPRYRIYGYRMWEGEELMVEIATLYLRDEAIKAAAECETRLRAQHAQMAPYLQHKNDCAWWLGPSVMVHEPKPGEARFLKSCSCGLAAIRSSKGAEA